MKRIRVELGDRSYPVLIGSGITGQMPHVVGKLKAVGKLYVIFDANLFALHSGPILAALDKCGCPIETLAIPLNERSKTLKTYQSLVDFLLFSGVRRSDLVIACGGGILTDLAGFAAATVLRGIRWGAISTTLLGMVDAAIGGKTGVNHSHGKNLIGAFWQPSFVLCDLDHLQTLPDRQFLAGMGEIVKYAGLVGEPMLSDCDAILDQSAGNRDVLLVRLVTQSVRCKADIVTEDEREGNLRMTLNLGHTFGHAIEKCLKYRGLLHGEAVLIGLLGAIHLSSLVRPSSRTQLAAYYNLVRRYVAQLPKRRLSGREINSAMESDKKHSGRANRFILLDRPGKPRIIERVDKTLVSQSIERMLADYGR